MEICSKLLEHNDPRVDPLQLSFVKTEEPLRTLIQRLSTLRFQTPAFSAAREQAFTADAEAFRSRRQQLEGLLSFGLYAAFAFLTQMLFPLRPALESLLRFGLVVALLLFMAVSMRIGTSRWIREAALLVASGTAACLEVAFQLLHQERGNYPAHLAIVVFLVFTNTVMRLRPAFATVAFSWASASSSC